MSSRHPHESRALKSGRRRFIQQSGVVCAGVALAPSIAFRVYAADESLRLVLRPVGMVGTLREDTGPGLIEGATWYVGEAEDDALLYRFPAGALAGAKYLTADFLLDGEHMAVFRLELQEGEEGPTFGLIYAALNACGARLRMPLEALNQNRWRYPREGAWLKPMASGSRVDLARVDRLRIRLLRKSERPVRWCQTAITATASDVPLLTDPVLPKGKLLDELGQSAIHTWPARTRSREEVTARLKAQLAAAPEHRWPSSFSRWGGANDVRFEASGYFRTHHDGSRWWLVDPDGHAFWSTGMDCVRVDTSGAYDGLENALTWLPPRDDRFRAAHADREADGLRTVNYLAANFIHAFGPDDWYAHWSTIALGELRRLGFNTVANWSDWEVARAAKFPYVRPLQPAFDATPKIYRELPDVFDPRFGEDARAFGQQLAATRDDPAFIGYFMMNEPTWGFSSESPAAGMLFTTERAASRQALRQWLEARYATDADLARAWGLPASFARIAEGRWTGTLTDAARKDLDAFSAVIVERFFRTLSEACRRVDPNHLNLGIRYHTVPPPWALDGMRTFDVFSMNCYESTVRAGEMASIAEMLKQPVLVGEWHFGALDVGLPASGIGRVRTQADRGRAFRVYTEDAAVKPWCVGVHYFTLYDQSAIGRFDGENYNIGFLDVCNRPYAPLAEAARASHERIYDLARGQVAPYADAPEYLPKLFV